MMTAEQALRQFTAVSDPAIVADVLLDMGITGRRRQHDACPIAGYLDQFCGKGWRVTSSHAWQPMTGQEVEVPPAVRWFVHEFDLGAYPMLEG